MKKWKPRRNKPYFFADYDNTERKFVPYQEIYGLEDSDTFDMEIFKTEKECQKFCDKLNQAISQVRYEHTQMEKLLSTLKSK